MIVDLQREKKRLIFSDMMIKLIYHLKIKKKEIRRKFTLLFYTNAPTRMTLSKYTYAGQGLTPYSIVI